MRKNKRVYYVSYNFDYFYVPLGDKQCWSQNFVRCRNDEEAKQRAMRWFQKQRKRLMKKHGVFIEEVDRDWDSSLHSRFYSKFFRPRTKEKAWYRDGFLSVSDFDPMHPTSKYLYERWLKNGDAINFDIVRHE